MLISRILTSKIKQSLQSGKVTIIYGPRQVGKSTLLNQLTQQLTDTKYLQVNADQLRYRAPLSSQNPDEMREVITDNELLIIDEAQRIDNAGLNLKIIVDNYPQLKVLITGSASLDLANKISEPLTGRKKIFYLYPISFKEIISWKNMFEAKNNLEKLLIYGSYPEALKIKTKKKREDYLATLVSSYLYKDILDFSGIKKPDKIVDLLRLIAFQIGQEVAIAELASNLALNRQTVEKYLDLLQKAFVIYKVSGFSRNLRKEIAKTNRYYFYDNGVRNALIENFNRLELRNDKGQLWENFLFIERLKFNQNRQKRANYYFWRTYDQKEIDLIEERKGKIFGYEFKWKGTIKKSTKQEFIQAYPQSTIKTINQENYLQFLTD